MLQLLGALVALFVVLYSFYALSRYVTARAAHQQVAIREAMRSRTLALVESELETLEAQKSNRTADEDQAYARLIRRRNHLVASV